MTSMSHTRGFLYAAALSSALVALPFSSSRASAQDKKQNIGLEGYCPVCIIEAEKWEKGSKQHETTYDGVTYRFPSAAIREKFLANPAKYVPALNGDCIVCLAMKGKRVPGSVYHAAYHNKRLYLFPGKTQKQAFLKSPEKFAKADLALKGDCAVCLDHVKKRVPGKPEFTEIHKGMRYMFPGKKQQMEFRKKPDHYSMSAMKASKEMTLMKNQKITIAGKTSCAGCEHGVKPVHSPKEMGLAVGKKGGRVFVIENAHKLYPEIYKSRFDGKQVMVSGKVIKQKGKFAWIEPTKLQLVK